MKGTLCLHSTFILQVALVCLAMAATTDITTDQAALLNLKAHIIADPYDILINWSIATPVCSWVGVTCGFGNRRVIALNLSDMALLGTVPSQVGNLSFLVSLSIRNNSFSGPLPPELACLLSLKYLDLGFNIFTGSIPPSMFNLSSMERLDLSSNSLSGNFPVEFFSHMPRLEVLLLSVNEFDGEIPISLFSCRQLKALSLSENNFTGIIPSEIGNLILLRQLNLDENQLSGSIPNTIANCSLLETINLSENNLTGPIPSEIGDLHSLEELILSGNLLNGHIASTIFNISSVRIIAMDANRLSGSLPSTLGLFLPNLQRLLLGRNELNGIIPSSICNASNLKLVDISYNLFTGLIPVTFGELKYLQRLNLAYNDLRSESSTSEWSFLSSLTNCQQLTKIELSGNPLDAILPISIGNLSTSLQQFWADNCNNRGSIPREIGNLTSLIALNLEYNELTDSIPSTLGRLQKLQGLYLEGNLLQGTITSDLCHFDSMFDLSLGGNQLFGFIPDCLGNLTTLRRLNLSSNFLNSTIPLTLWNLHYILSINMSSNSLGGPVPLEIKNLRVLVDIDLSSNKLSGEIPYSIGDLNNLAFLSLARNNFEGPIPSPIGNALSLEYLDFSYNHLSGEIPKSLGTLKFLTYFNVSFNELQGEIPEAFRNFSDQSFMMNRALCGAGRVQVPPCKTNAPKRTMKPIKFILVLVLPLFGLVMLGSQIFLWLRWQQQGKTLADRPTSERYSYLELERATDRFSEGSLIGNGRFGSVFKGILEDGLVVAIKVFNLEEEPGSTCFDVECEVMHNICHRNLIRILCSISTIKFKALVMEYMVNGSLEKWLYTHNYHLDIVQRLDIMIDIASALEYLHYDYSKTIIHCDLKPSNILLDEDMIAHVSNFSFAKIVDSDAPDSTQDSRFMSSKKYMAPEFRSNGTVSKKTDVYSFGILLMETFTGKKPDDEMFTGEMSLRRWVLESLPHEVEKVMDRCLLQTEEEHLDAKLECFSYIVKLAQGCSEESPFERFTTKEVVSGLNRIKDTFLKHISGE